MTEVQRIARRVLRLFSHPIDVDELVQAGCVGLVQAANRYDPKCGRFEAYAYFRIRGAMIDSQKRKPFREAQHVSLQAIAAAHDGWLPPALDTSPGPAVDEVLMAPEINQALVWAIGGLSGQYREAFRCHVAGLLLPAIGVELGVSLRAARELLREAKLFVAHRLRSPIGAELREAQSGE